MSWYEFKEIHCTHSVLQRLSTEAATYSRLFKLTQVSHTTLQRVLSDLIIAKAIVKISAKETRRLYEITAKGKKLDIHLDAAMRLSKK
ncbi:hypothetical protein [Cerasicoccus maritimus]|uniref:hypothetical protein n=1 Tax=Cerasicoccus maritimus TaxID=490089 RepID=UPI00285297DF|nr:hypothetical protein [Cerasicoccus maritimus]